jgi:hypothetical protein
MVTVVEIISAWLVHGLFKYADSGADCICLQLASNSPMKSEQ